jgi:hypothetical protein
MNKKYFKYFLILSVTALGLSFGGRYLIKSSTPPFVIGKLDELKKDKRLMDSIGGFKYFEYSYNKNDLKFRDTVKYSITIKGSDRELVYNGVQLRISSGSNDWKQVGENLLIE